MAGTNTNVKRIANGQKIAPAKLIPLIAELRAKGKTGKEISAIVGRSERRVWQILRELSDSGDSRVSIIPEARDASQLTDDVKKCIEFTAEGFERFFNRYSGRILQPVHKDWVSKALSTTRTLINCPPRHAKSTIFSAWFPIWLLAGDRDLQILICSQTEKLAKKFTNEIAYHLSYNQDLIKDFGRFRPDLTDWPWRPNSGELLVDGRRRGNKSGDLSIQVRGAGQAILGMEANWIIVDDAVTRKITRSETEREGLAEWFHGDVMSRLEPGGRAIVIGQRLHLHDLYGHLAEQQVKKADGSYAPRWKHINYRAIEKWPEENSGVPVVLWPEKWTFEDLMETYADLGQSLFESMYQQNPLPEGEALARRAWIYGDESHLGCLDMDRRYGHPATGPGRRVRVLSLDPSPTRYAAFIVADVVKNKYNFEVEIIEIIRSKMSVRDMLNHLDRAIEIYQPTYFVFEQNAAQRWLLQDPAMDAFRRKVRVIPHVTSRNKGDALLGIESLAVDFEFGRIRLPYGDSEAKQASELLIKEALEYPQSETDDVLMALWFLKFNYSRLSPLDIEDNNRLSRGRGWRIPPRINSSWNWGKGSTGVAIPKGKILNG